MPETKPWYTSVGVWGAIVALLATAARVARINIDDQVQADLVTWLTTAGTLVGSGMALWGRARAKTQITFK